ncbi:molecular chaperone [Desulfitobacterium sp. PCE1]|uniref:TorD/DmsD family molecular chaperone n=1 Tax=Desulfitobacterium sp. PCE1 TaxID=146907 RepID=UPI000368307E|nr:molecular chaperone TorD family protein [Desulfitobacterium sp. PCE1]
MAELMCPLAGTARTRNLAIRVETLMALSRVFSAGGEKLEQTLAGLIEAYRKWLKEKAGDQKEDRELLDQLLKVHAEDDKKRWVYEFNRLFIGPQSPPAPPYESVYRHGERQVMQESTLDVRRWYRSQGLSLAGQSNEPDDFIATELEFAAYLLTQALKREQRNQPKKAEAFIENYNAFCQEHLAAWLPGFVKALSASAREPFYLALGEIMQRVVVPVR